MAARSGGGEAFVAVAAGAKLGESADFCAEVGPASGVGASRRHPSVSARNAKKKTAANRALPLVRAVVIRAFLEAIPTLSNRDE
jgi:hypothetical protein